MFVFAYRVNLLFAFCLHVRRLVPGLVFGQLKPVFFSAVGTMMTAPASFFSVFQPVVFVLSAAFISSTGLLTIDWVEFFP